MRLDSPLGTQFEIGRKYKVHNDGLDNDEMNLNNVLDNTIEMVNNEAMVNMEDNRIRDADNRIRDADVLGSGIIL